MRASRADTRGGALVFHLKTDDDVGDYLILVQWLSRSSEFVDEGEHVGEVDTNNMGSLQRVGEGDVVVVHM